MRTNRKKFLYNIWHIILLVFLLDTNSVCAFENWRLNEINVHDDGYFEKSDGDPFIVFPEIKQPTCAPMGVQLSITFKPVPIKPILLEVFWSTDYLGFGEENKVFFIIHPHKDGRPNNFVVPLGHTAGFRQVRLDFPSYISTTFKVENYAIIPITDAPSEFPVIDAYYNLSIEESLKPDILIPYFIKALAHGPQRLLKDPFFFIFWLLTIGSLLVLIRLSARNLWINK